MSGTDAERVEIEPALTPEQWLRLEAAAGALVSRRDIARVRVDHGFVVVETGGGADRSLHFVPKDLTKALAALSLQKAGPDGGPMFTHEHLLALHTALDIWEAEESGRPGAEWHVLATLRDALASILPPEQAQSNAET